MSTGTLVGLTGFARSGKDELADALVRRCGYVKLGWADALYELALHLNPDITTVRLLGIPLRKEKLSSIVKRDGWTKAKENMEIRQYLQDLGQGAREKVHPDVWVTALEPRIREHLKNGNNVVITNCRYDNEAEKVKQMGGSIIRVVRPGVGPVNNHPSEAGFAFKHAIWEVVNAGTLEDLEYDAVDLHKELNRPVTKENAGTSEFMLERYRQVCERALHLGVKYVLQLSCPDPDDAEEWINRNRVQASVDETDDEFSKEIHIEVNGEGAGVVCLEDGIVTVECYLAR